MSDYDFTAPIGELLARDHGKSRGSGMPADELGVPMRLWIRDKNDIEGTQGIYYFFGDPEDPEYTGLWSKVDELRTQWLEPTGGLTAPLPRSLAEIPLKRAQGRRWKDRFADDPMVGLFHDREGRTVNSSQAGLTSVVTPEGDVRLLGFKQTEYEAFQSRIAEIAEADDDFTLRGRALRVTKSGKFPGMQLSVVPVSKDADGNRIETRIDMDDYEPFDLGEYLGDIRARAEKWVADHTASAPAAPAASDDGMTVEEKRDFVRKVLKTDEEDPDDLIASASDMDNEELKELLVSLTGQDQGNVRRVTLFKKLKAEIG